MRMRKNPEEIIRSFKITGSVKKTAEIVGVHKTTVYRWLVQARGGWSNHLKENLKRKPTTPKNIEYALSTTERIRIRELRAKKEWDARKIKYALKLSASHMAVYRYLKRQKLVRELKKYRRPWSQDTVHMHVKNTF